MTTEYSYKFTNCGKIGIRGPDQSDADKCYLNTNVNVTIVGEGIQKWTVPFHGRYLIEAAGSVGHAACSSYSGGKGARYLAFFTLKEGDILYILPGQYGYISASNWGGSGGGATFVVKKEKMSDYYLTVDKAYVKPLLIAAGGGGSGDCNGAGSPKNGDPGHCETLDEGSGATNQGQASGGAGFVSDSKNGLTKSFINGGVAGYASDSSGYGYGGFGGGGNPFDAGGGGGGYKGSDSGSGSLRGFGGYSYNSGTFVKCESGVNQAAGFANIYLSTKLARKSACPVYRNNSFSMLFLLIIIVSK